MYFKNGPFISEKVVGHTVIKMIIFLAGRRYIVNEKKFEKKISQFVFLSSY